MWIYRGAGKSKLRLVFLNVPYGRVLEIGGLDGVFRPKSGHFGTKKWSFWVIFGPKSGHFLTIFDNFVRFERAWMGFLARVHARVF